MGTEKTKAIAWQLEAFRILSEHGGHDGLRTGEVHTALLANGWSLTDRAVREGLQKMEAAGLLVSLRADTDPSRPQDRRSRCWQPAHDAELRPNRLSSSTALSLGLVESFLGDLLPAAIRASLEPYFAAARNKLRTADLRHGQWAGKVRVLPGWQRLLPAEFREEVREVLFECLLGDMVCRVTFRHADQQREVLDVCPLAVCKRGDVFYVIARPGDSPDERPLVLPMHRIIEAECRYQGFDRGRFDLDTFLRNGAEGFQSDAPEIDLELVFTLEAGRHLFDTPLVKGQRLTSTGDGQHLRLRARVPLTPQLRWWVLGFGDRVEVIGPAALRAEIAGCVARAAKQYARERQPEERSDSDATGRMDEDLRQAFLRTEYRVEEGLPVLFHINRESDALDTLLDAHGVTEATFLTAYNPYGGWHPRRVNEAAQARMEAALRDAGFRFLRGTGSDPDGRWAPEASVLVLGMDEATATRWAHDWCQAAVVQVRHAERPRLLRFEAEESTAA